MAHRTERRIIVAHAHPGIISSLFCFKENALDKLEQDMFTRACTCCTLVSRSESTALLLSQTCSLSPAAWEKCATNAGQLTCVRACVRVCQWCVRVRLYDNTDLNGLFAPFSVFFGVASMAVDTVMRPAAAMWAEVVAMSGEGAAVVEKKQVGGLQAVSKDGAECLCFFFICVPSGATSSVVVCMSTAVGPASRANVFVEVVVDDSMMDGRRRRRGARGEGCTNVVGIPTGSNVFCNLF